MHQVLLRRLISWLQQFVVVPTAGTTVHTVADVAQSAVHHSPGDEMADMVVAEITTTTAHVAMADDVPNDATPIPQNGIVRVVSFLGANLPNKTRYYIDGTSTNDFVETRFTGYAVHTFFNADETLFFCTTAANTNYQQLVSNHADFTNQRKIDIPDGMTAAQMWEIFYKLTEEVMDGEHLIVDVSNSFRSIPFVVSAALSFLQEVRDIKIQRVVYGAYAREAGIHTSIINLQPFIDLNRWVSATHTFTHYAHGAELADLLKNLTHTPQSPWRKIGRKLSELTTALQLVHLSDVSDHAGDLRQLVEILPTDIPAEYLPIKMLLTKVTDEYLAFTRAATVYDELKRQQMIIKWYIDHHMQAQAILLAREVLVSLSIYRTNLKSSGINMFEKLADHNTREKVEIDVEWKQLGKDVRLARNDLAHALFTDQRQNRHMSAGEVKRRINELCARVIDLPIPMA